MGAADTAIVRTSLLDADLGALDAGVPELRQLLLRWWESHGRHSIPWKLRPDGLRPVPGEPPRPVPDMGVRDDASSQTTQQPCVTRSAAMDGGGAYSRC